MQCLFWFLRERVCYRSCSKVYGLFFGLNLWVDDQDKIGIWAKPASLIATPTCNPHAFSESAHPQSETLIYSSQISPKFDLSCIVSALWKWQWTTDWDHVLRSSWILPHHFSPNQVTIFFLLPLRPYLCKLCFSSNLFDWF